MRMRPAIIFLLFFFSTSLSVSGQYYDWGQSPASIKWMSVQDTAVRVVYPSYFKTKALATFGYLGSVRPYINYGYTRGPMKTPVVLHTQNFAANGIVMLAPRRIELITNPSGTGYATPWMKQLAVHEYRHAVQFNNMNVGVIRWLRYILGEQGWMIGSWGFPLWMMEGDAVMAETQFTSYGRGLQPSFTLEYRAMHGERMPRYRTDKYFSGSFKDYIPDHYQLGYQLVSYAATKYDDPSFPEKVGTLFARRPYLIFTTSAALRKYYGTNDRGLFEATIDDLAEHWDSLPAVDENFDTVDTERRSYTTYHSPTMLADGKIYSVRRDFGRFNRMVEADTAGNEKTLFYLGNLNNPPVYDNGRFYWTELRSSTFWEERVNSRICYYDMATGRKGEAGGSMDAVHPTPVGNGAIAYAEYHREGYYTVTDGSFDVRLPDSVSLHGLAGDAQTGALYMIGLSDEGMWLGSFSADGELRRLTPPTRTTISNLTARDGVLYYGSTASGRDEIHAYDVASGREYQVTRSKYGSYSPTVSEDGGTITFVSYSDAKRGYALSRKAAGSEPAGELTFSAMPANLVNPARRQWNLFNIDTVRLSANESGDAGQKKYSKASHLFRVHSWAPFYFDPDQVVEDLNFNINWGATLLSQNTLSSTTAQAGYGYSGQGGSVVHASLKYYGWAPKFELSGVWGGSDRQVYASVPPGTSIPAPDMSKRYFRATLRGYLPITFDAGYHVRQLTPVVELSRNNALLLKPDASGYINGYQSMTAYLQYSDNVRMAYRDFAPRFGYFLRAAYTSDPFSSDFGKIYSGYGRVNLPGAAPHHSLMLRGTYQYQSQGFYNSARWEIYPRGASSLPVPVRYGAFSADYQFPAWYPDGGINSILYLKRLRFNFGYDYSLTKAMGDGRNYEVWSYGGDMYIDFTVNRMPASATCVFRLSVYKPSDDGSPFVSAGLTVPI